MFETTTGLTTHAARLALSGIHPGACNRCRALNALAVIDTLIGIIPMMLYVQCMCYSATAQQL